jgi:[ribosomal protein S18]-alanine N-acetyltransferase
MAELRAMAAGDLDAVVALAVESTGAPQWTRQIYEEAIGLEGSAALVAMEGDVLAGFAIGVLVLDVCQIESIVVAEEFRRRGVGSALLAAVVAWLRERNGRRVELEVRAGNDGAIALYAGAGFLREGIRRGYYRNPDEDAVLMSLALDSPATTVEKIP